MTTTAQQNQSYAFGGRSLPYPVDATGSNDINQGDLVYYDTSAHVVKSTDTDGHAAYAAGVAKETSFINLYGTKVYPDSGTIEVYTEGVFTFKSTAGDTLNHGDAVYIGADAQTVTNTTGGTKTAKIGYVWLRPGQSAVTGAAGTNIDVLITPLFPVTGGL